MVKEGLLRPITPDQVHITLALSTFHKKSTRQCGGGDSAVSKGHEHLASIAKTGRIARNTCSRCVSTSPTTARFNQQLNKQRTRTLYIPCLFCPYAWLYACPLTSRFWPSTPSIKFRANPNEDERGPSSNLATLLCPTKT